MSLMSSSKGMKKYLNAKCYNLLRAEFHVFLNLKTVTILGFTYWLNNVIKKKSLFLKEEDWYGYFQAGIFSIPHYKKRAKGGEDASFQSQNLLVVADGVGGWNEIGIDPAQYSKSLCDLISKNFQKYDSEIIEKNKKKINEIFIKQLIIKSVKQNKELGSSTLCVIYLNKANNEIYSGYIGDSCYLIARPRSIGNFKVLFKSEEQTHGFNIPYQVGSEGDDASRAIINKHKVEKNDIFIVATDGLWDNLEVEDIIKEINSISVKNKSIVLNTDEVAKHLSSIAEVNSLKSDYESPFAKRAKDSNYKNYNGGKPDDITIIAAQILKNNIYSNDDADTTIDGIDNGLIGSSSPSEPSSPNSNLEIKLP